MFNKKKETKKDFFMFNCFCNDKAKCVAFSISNGLASADWYDENGVQHVYEGREITKDFWQSLKTATESNGVYEWKAPKLYKHFAFSLDTTVFNAEANFPDGSKINANNFYGEPDNFEQAINAYKEIFASLE